MVFWGHKENLSILLQIKMTTHEVKSFKSFQQVFQFKKGPKQNHRKLDGKKSQS